MGTVHGGEKVCVSVSVCVCVCECVCVGGCLFVGVCVYHSEQGADLQVSPGGPYELRPRDRPVPVVVQTSEDRADLERKENALVSGPAVPLS